MHVILGMTIEKFLGQDRRQDADMPIPLRVPNVHGHQNVETAVFEGREAAMSIAKYLGDKYGWRDGLGDAVRQRVNELLGMLAERSHAAGERVGLLIAQVGEPELVQ